MLADMKPDEIDKRSRQLIETPDYEAGLTEIETFLASVPVKELDEHMQRLRGDQIDVLPSEYSSEADDKTDKKFWSLDPKDFDILPKNVQEAVKKSKEKAKHSEFYHKLKNLRERIKTFQGMFYDRKPYYQ